jgi:hypothetical protein
MPGRIVAEAAFRGQLLWHSHCHEMTSGELVMSRTPKGSGKHRIASLVNTYGETWHTWPIDRDSTPRT